MWKFNKYTIGDILAHNETPTLKFQVNNVLPAQKEAEGDYLYCCVVLNGNDDESGEEYNYHESDLSLTRKGTKEELEIMLNNAVEDENYEFAEIVKKQIDKLK